MAMLSMAIPILPGMTEKWETEILGRIRSDKTAVDAIRNEAGVHERTFLQRTPHGDVVILTLEGDDPVAGWGKMMELLPDDWRGLMSELHGIDPNAPPPTLPELVYDSKS